MSERPTEAIPVSSEDKAKAVREYIRHANGSENFTRHWTKRLIFTDGVKFVAETCGAHWLVDLIASHQHERKVKAEPFQVWTLNYCGDERYSVICTDGNDVYVTEQAMDYTDFPHELFPFAMWLEGGTLMLPAER